MKLALIPPISWLGTSEVTNYQLMLPHLSQHPRYAAHYRALGQRPDQYIILDNGEAEGQNYLSSAQLVGLGIHFRVKEVVIPDVMGDSVETLNRMKDFFRAIRDLRSDAFGPIEVAKLKFMGVAQGKTRKEVQDCIDMMMELYGNKLTTIALPRHLLQTCDAMSARLDLAEYIANTYGIGTKDGHKEIHCLGASKISPIEMLELGAQGIVRGMDTSMPFNWAYYDKYLNHDLEIIERPKNYFDRRAGLFKADALHHNIGVMKRWAEGISPGMTND